MQITSAIAAPAVVANAAAAPTASVDAADGSAPRFTGGIEYVGAGRFARFTATTAGASAGKANGYGSLDQALDALTMLTIGAAQPAVGVFERDGRFFGRQMKVDVVFEKGATWKGPWKLEQYPSDREMFDGGAKGVATRAEALRAIVDGAQRIDVSDVPVA